MLWFILENHHQCHQAAQNKHKSTCVLNLLFTDSLADPFSKLNCGTSTNAMSQEAAKCYKEQIITCSQSDSSNLRSVSPFSQECHNESLSQDNAICENNFGFSLRAQFLTQSIWAQLFLAFSDEIFLHLFQFLFDLKLISFYLFHFRIHTPFNFLCAICFIKELKAEVEEQNCHNDVCVDFWNQREKNLTEYCAHKSHHEQSSVCAKKHDEFSVLHCHYHRQKEGLISCLAHEHSQERCTEGCEIAFFMTTLWSLFCVHEKLRGCIEKLLNAFLHVQINKNNVKIQIFSINTLKLKFISSNQGKNLSQR